MIFIALWVIVVAFAAVASGIIVGHNSYTKISQTFPTICSFINRRRRNTTRMPIITKDGEIIESVDQLSAHLQALNEKLQRIIIVKSENKARYLSIQDKINKLDFNKYELKKYSNRIKNEISCNESDCVELQTQINDFLKRREDLQRELLANQYPFASLANITTKSGSRQSLDGSMPEILQRGTSESKIQYRNKVSNEKPKLGETKPHQGLCKSGFQHLYEEGSTNEFDNRLENNSIKTAGTPSGPRPGGFQNVYENLERCKDELKELKDEELKFILEKEMKRLDDSGATRTDALLKDSLSDLRGISMKTNGQLNQAALKDYSSKFLNLALAVIRQHYMCEADEAYPEAMNSDFVEIGSDRPMTTRSNILH